MDRFTLMRMSEACDDDAVEPFDFDLEMSFLCEKESERFKVKYKEYYDDVKLSHKEDW